VKIHIVKEGDTLYELSKKFDVPLTKIIDANPQLVDPNKLDVGAKIKIPTEPVPVPGGSQPIIHKHTVKQGDSLWKLSKAWGVTLKEIIDANPQLKNPNALLVGEIVNIPSSGIYTETGDSDGVTMSAEVAPGKKKPGSKDYTGVKEEITQPVPQPPVVPPQPMPEPPVLPKLPEIAPLPEEPKKVEPEYKPEIKPEYKPEIKPEYKPEVKPEFKPELKPEYKPEHKPEIKPEFKPEFKPEYKPEFKPFEPEQMYPLKMMPLPHPVLPVDEPCPKVADFHVQPFMHPCPEFPIHHVPDQPCHGPYHHHHHGYEPQFTMPQYGYPESPCGCHEPVKWQDESVHPYYHVPQPAVPASHGDAWGIAAGGYPGLSGDPVGMEYSQISVSESYTAGVTPNYMPYPEHHGISPLGYASSPCGCQGGEVSPFYGMPQSYPYAHQNASEHAMPYNWQHGAMNPSGAYSVPSAPLGAFGANPTFVNPYEQMWIDRQNEEQGVGTASGFTEDASPTNHSVEESDQEAEIRDAAIEENSKATKAKVHRQSGGKASKTAAKKTRKPQSAKNKQQNPWIKG